MNDKINLETGSFIKSYLISRAGGAEQAATVSTVMSSLVNGKSEDVRLKISPHTNVIKFV